MVAILPRLPDLPVLRRLYAETARLLQQEPGIERWRVVVLCPSRQLHFGDPAPETNGRAPARGCRVPGCANTAPPSSRGSGLQPCQPLRCGKHRDRAPSLLLPGITHDLHSLGFPKLRRETEQGPVG